MARGDPPENIDEFEVKIDWVVSDAVRNDVDVDEMKSILNNYLSLLEKEDWVERRKE